MRALVLLAAVSLMACGAKEPNSTDAGTDSGVDAGMDAGVDAGVDAGQLTYYPDGGSQQRYWDGGTCAVKTQCPCFSSDDCGPGFNCHSEDSTGLHIYCVPGARGAGSVGDPCTVEGDCQSALCTDSASTGQRCSALCDLAAECPSTLPRCTWIGFGVDRSICAP